MISRTVFLSIAMAILLQSGLAVAQRPGMGMAGLVPPGSRFAAAPQTGEQLPDLTIFDDEGNPVKLREVTSGHYTVLTLGCLT